MYICSDLQFIKWYLLKNNRKHRPLARLCLQDERAVVLLDDLAREAESDAASFLFGAEEGDENLVNHVGRYSGAVVGNGERYFSIYCYVAGE